MSRCELCGEMIDWDNPNIHYGGHTCDIERLDKVGATERYVKSTKEPYNPTGGQTCSFDTDKLTIPSRTPFKCPICEGKGIVPGGFYNSTDGHSSSTSLTEKCRQCNGTGIIWG